MFTFDDGSALNWNDDYSIVTATPMVAADMVTNTDGSSFFDVLDSVAGAATRVGNTIVTLQGQAGALATAKARNELERYRTLAAVNVGKSQADVATINAQRDVAIAKANLASLSGSGGLMTLLLLGGAAWAFMKS